MSAKVYQVPFNRAEREALAVNLKRFGIQKVRSTLYYCGLDEVVIEALIKNTLRKYGY